MSEIPFYKPTVGSQEADLINSVLKFNNLDTMNEKLETDMQELVKTKHVISTNNATAALHLALCAMDLKRGDKIICSVNSSPAIAEVIRHFDAEPIFVDIDKDDFNIDPRQFDRILRMHNHKKLKGAFISHIAGQPADLEPLYDIAKEYKIKILDDASQALGATYKGKIIGNTGSFISCFRFSPQTINALADGGILTTNDEEIASRAKLLKNHAIVSDGWDEFGNLGYVYDVVDKGVKYDMSELSAAYNIGQLSNLQKRIKRRQEIAKIYDKELEDCPHVSTPTKKRDHVYDKYIIKIDKNRDSFARELKEQGIFTGLHYIPLHLLQYYKTKYSLKVNDYPTALLNYQQILSLPIYDLMSDDMVMYVSEAIKKIAKSRA